MGRGIQRQRQPGDPLTTGQLARICNVSINCVKAWHRTGRLPGMQRAVPGKAYGRLIFTEAAVVKFLKTHSMSYLIPEVSGNYADLLH